MKPREKLSKYWVHKLEWWELVAVILWAWVKWMDVFKLSKRVNKVIEGKWENIQIEDLTNIMWIWPVKAQGIISAFELAKRYFIKESIIIKSSNDILEQVKEYRNKQQEYLLCLTLDWANRLINNRIITIWLLNQGLVHPREVFADAIWDRANSIVLVHNHPSWTISPSDEDIKITNRIKEVSEIIWIKLLDHIIITKKSYFSFIENNIL
jgi:DNA repair protein RadC